MEGYFCENCGTALSDEQKFCPKCGTPKKQVQENVSEAQPENKPKYCTNCGRQITAEDVFCPGCGRPQNQAPPTDFVQQMRQTYKSADQSNNYNNYNNNYGNNSSSTQYVNQNNEEDAYIQVKIDYYKRRFEKFWLSDSKASWNWCSFLFVAFWFIYRKMYKWGFGALAIQLVFSCIGGWGSSLLLFAMAITSGILGNYIYKQHIDKLVNEGRMINEPGRSEHIRKFGGVNKSAMILTLVGYFILLCILSAAGIYGEDDTYYDYSSTSNTTYCSVSGCENYAEYGDYCIDHVCLAGGCTNQRVSGSDYCSLHQDLEQDSM